MTPTTTDEVEIRVDQGVLGIRFTRPEVLNALTALMLDRITASVVDAGGDPQVRAILITGEGRAFSSGADLGREAESDAPGGAVLAAANELVAALVASPKPVVAAVNGAAAGVGATIAVACDLVVARASSYFLLAFTRIGLMPDGGASAIVTAAVGRARAARMALLAERVSAATAFDWGLISHVVPDEEFDDQVQSIVQTLAAGPTTAYAKTKTALTAASLALLEQAHALEAVGQHELFATADFAEGVAAFRERRPAVFTGR